MEDQSSHCIRKPVSNSLDATEGFYRRPLPSSTCIAFESSQGRSLFKEALEKGTMESYFSLAANFVTQADPATCGLGTLSMVLNSLEVDPDRIWKGSWRWYSEEMLDCCSPLETVRQRGMNLEEFACTAVCNGAAISKHRVVSCGANEADWEQVESQFRETLKEVCSHPEKKLVVSYDRSTLLQTGTGHFSPVGGYHEGTDKVLILDVARFKYPPHWVPLKLLVKSMATLDTDTGLSRGYVVLKKSSAHMSAVLRVNIGRSQWRQFADSYRSTMLSRLKQSVSKPSNAIEYLQLSCTIISDIQVMDYLVEYVDSMEKLAEEHVAHIQHVFSEMERTRILTCIRSFPEACCKAYLKPGYKEIATIFILAQGPIGLELLGGDSRSEIQALFEESLPRELEIEVTALSNTLAALSPGCECQKRREGESSENSSKPSSGCCGHSKCGVNVP